MSERTGDGEERPSRGRRPSLGNQILIGVVAGIVCGVLFGELCAPLKVAGDVYVGLLQMTVLPYVIVSLIGRIGRLSWEEAGSVARKASVVLLALWALALGTIVVMPLALPDWEAGTFFSTGLVERPGRPDFVGLYIPTNPFYSLANNVVPAVVLFSICIGVALIPLGDKGRLLDPLEVLGSALSRISGFVVRLSPYGTFAMMAAAAGTLAPDTLLRLQGYLAIYTVAVLFLTFLALPLLVSAVTKTGYLQLMRGYREAGLTAFATGKLFAVLTMIIAGAQRILAEQGVPPEQAQNGPDVFVPMAYPFPNAGKLLALLFVPFTAWFVGRPLDLTDAPLLLSVGLLSLFGSPVAAIPFLLDAFKLPTDLFPLFLVAGVWTARMGDVAGSMHLLCFTVVSTAAVLGRLVLSPLRLFRWVAITTGCGVLAIVGTRSLLALALAGQEPSESLVADMELEYARAPAKVLDEALPNPDPRQPGESHFQRIRRRGRLRVGFLPESPPFSYLNGAGRLVGFDVELMHRLAAELELVLEFAPIEFTAVFDALGEDRIDLAIGGLPSSIDSFGRARESSTYLELHFALLVADHRVREFQRMSSIRAFEDLTVGITGNEYLARRLRMALPNAEVVVLDSPHPFLRGERPEIDVLLSTAERGSVMTMLYPRLSVVVPEGARGRAPLVFLVQEDAVELAELLDAWVELKRADGFEEDLYDYWILGKGSVVKPRRWSLVQDVLGWLD